MVERLGRSKPKKRTILRDKYKRMKCSTKRHRQLSFGSMNIIAYHMLKHIQRKVHVNDGYNMCVYDFNCRISIE